MNGLPRVRLVQPHYDLTATAPVTLIELVERILSCEESKMWAYLRARGREKGHKGADADAAQQSDIHD